MFLGKDIIECKECKKEIYKYSNIYFGCDKIFCSNNCREKNLIEIFKLDPLLKNPNSWKFVVNKKKKNSVLNLENIYIDHISNDKLITLKRKRNDSILNYFYKLNFYYLFYNKIKKLCSFEYLQKF